MHTDTGAGAWRSSARNRHVALAERRLLPAIARVRECLQVNLWQTSWHAKHETADTRSSGSHRLHLSWCEQQAVQDY